MMFAYFHGEGILFSSLIHGFFGLLGAAALLYGVVKYRSLVGMVIAIVYEAVTLLVSYFSPKNLLLESVSWVLTLPWNAVLPCYNLDSSCPRSLGVSFISAQLNASILFFLSVWVSRSK